MKVSDLRQATSAPRTLNRLQVLRALRLANWEAALSNVHLSLTTGAFQTGFALWLGAGTRLMGVIGAIPTLAALAQLPASYLTERIRRRKPLSAWSGFVARLIWLPILLLPFIAVRSTALAVFVGLLIVSSIGLQASTPPYISWMADLVPPEHLGRYFGRRNMIAGFCGIVVALPMAWFVDLAQKSHLLPSAVGFAVPFAAAVLCGIAGFLILLRPAEPAMVPQTRPLPNTIRELLAFYRSPFIDRAFRPLLVFSGLFALSQFFAAPFYTVYALEVLGFSYVTLQIMAAASGVASMLAMPLIGTLTDRYGNKPVLVLSVSTVSLLPMVWVFCRPEHMTAALVLVFLNNLAGGIGWAGAALAQFNMMIAATPTERKSVYVGAVSTLVGISGGVAPLIGATLVAALRGHAFAVSGWPVDEYQATFAVNSCLRLVALGSLRFLTDGSTARPQDVIAHLGQFRFANVRQLRKLQTGTREVERRRAVRALSGRQGIVAQAELIAALSDPSLHVREDAAIALGESREPRAVQALIASLDDPSCPFAACVAEALGIAGDPRAVPVLAKVVLTAGTRVATAAALALGRIGDGGAVESLVARLERAAAEHEEEVARACTTALGAIGDQRAAASLVRLLNDGSAHIREELENALGKIGGRDAAAALTERLRAERDPVATVRLAVALASTRAPAGIDAMLEALDRIEGPDARLVVINAAGVLAGLEDVLYPALADDDYERTALVVRALDEMARAAPSLAGQLGALRADYLAGDCAGAARKLPRTNTPGPLSQIAAWAHRAGDSATFGADELMLALFASRAALASGEETGSR